MGHGLNDKNINIITKFLEETFSKKLVYERASGTSLVVQWLRFYATHAGGLGAIPGWGTKISHAAQQGPKLLNRRRKKEPPRKYIEKETF